MILLVEGGAVHGEVDDGFTGDGLYLLLRSGTAESGLELDALFLVAGNLVGIFFTAVAAAAFVSTDKLQTGAVHPLLVRDSLVDGYYGREILLGVHVLSFLTFEAIGLQVRIELVFGAHADRAQLHHVLPIGDLGSEDVRLSVLQHLLGELDIGLYLHLIAYAFETGTLRLS